MGLVTRFSPSHIAQFCRDWIAMLGYRSADHNDGSSRACHPTADSAPRSAGAGHRSIRLQQVDRKYGCQDFHWRSAAPRRDYLNAA